MGRLLTSDQLAEWLGCSRDHVYDLVKQGMPSMRLGLGPRSEYRFSLDDVKPWLRTCTGANSVQAGPGAGPPERVFGTRTYIT